MTNAPSSILVPGGTNQLRLAGRTATVTAAGRGLGRAIAWTFNTGFRGTFWAMQPAFPHMRKRGRRIVNFASGTA
jgi:NAD(P)-dependent dehydrogenase (short-subunit alcohol dehydrogenase family)